MNVNRRDVGAVTMLHLDGDLDEHGVDALRTAMFDCLTEGRCRIVMDLSNVGFISYMGVGVLVERLRKLRMMNGDLKLAGLNVYGQRMFRMIGVTGLFDCYETGAQAAATFQEAA